MSLSTSSESDTSTISLFSETASESESYSSVLAVAELDMQDVFPDCPFNLDCFNDANMLDYKFTDEIFILVYDDRLNYVNGNFENMTEIEKINLRHYTLIQSKHNDPITLRQIINTMMKQRYYSSQKIQKLFGHYYLEKFEQRSKRTWEVCWGH